ncbi:MAG: hypothetical protein ABFD10_18530 [Prolixibacteraceae bacterium]
MSAYRNTEKGDRKRFQVAGSGLQAILLPAVIYLCLSCHLHARAQCSGISLSGYGGYLAFTTYSELQNGKTASQYLTLAWNLPYNTRCPGWKLTIRASGEFTGGTGTIAAQYSSILFNSSASSGPSPSSIPMPTSPIPLSTTETIVVAQSNAALQAPPNYYFTHKFDLIIQGGAHLFVPNGIYCTTLTFSLYDQNGKQVSATSLPICFTINYQGSGGGSSLSLANGGNSVSFNYSSFSDHKNGITISKPASLYVTSYHDYQIIVQTVDPDFTSSSISGTFPVSVVTLVSGLADSSPSGCNAGVTCNVLGLSDSSQVLISNTNTDYPCQQLHYDLIYSTQPNDPDLFSAPAGSYEATLLLILAPL